MKNILFMCGLFLFIGIKATAQETAKQQPFPLKVSILDESISLPNFWFVNYSYNPAIMIGTEYQLKHKGRNEWYVGANLGFYHHAQSQTALFLNGEIGYRYHLNRWNISPRIGIGYAHTFYPGPVYTLEDGNFSERANLGQPNFMASVGIDLGYKIKEQTHSPEVMLTFMSSAEFPLSIYTSLHQFVGLGIKFYPFISTNN